MIFYYLLNYNNYEINIFITNNITVSLLTYLISTRLQGY